METDKKKRVNIGYLFQRYLRLERGYSQNTIDAYMRDISKLSEFLHGNGMEVLEARLSDLESFSEWVAKSGVGQRSHARILSGVRSLYHFLVVDGFLEEDPSELLESPSQPRHLPEVLSVEEVDRLIDSIDLDKWEGQRNRAIIEVLFSCGLRVSELVTLRISCLYREERYLRVLGKGGKERLVPISQRAIDEIDSWFVQRDAMVVKPGEEDFVFLNRRGSHLTRTMVLIMIKKYAAMAGLKKTISPHTLRHSFATVMLEGGADLRVIQEMLGHEDISTTEIYTHIDTSMLREEILKHHPRNKA
ncbi:MAG: site-specific tyrosine recombinase XerD [Prevotella sp.]|nr:site-specific tyrosine recombinase XerD [Prevotella sp.]